MLDLIVIILLLVILVNSNSSLAKKFRLKYQYEMHLHYLLFYHVFFSLFYTWYIVNFGGDSLGYWEFRMEQVRIYDPTWMKYFGEGTTFILWVCYIPSRILGLSYLTGNVLFGFLGFIGIRYLFLLVYKFFPTNHSILQIPLFPTIFYFPNLHFWSSGVGKDSLCFWAIAWFFYSIQEYKSRWWQGALAFFMVFMARPHVGQALIAGAGVAILLGSEIKRQYKFPLAILALVGAVAMSERTLEAVKLSEYSLESIEAFSLIKSGNLNKSYVGSGVNLSSYAWPMRLFTYLFRPLFFDAHNIMSFLSSFENLTYLWLSLFIYRNWTPEALRDMPIFIKAGMITFVPITLAFMNALSNLGITMRMKNMFMIYFLLFSFYLIVHGKKTRYLRAVDRLRFFQKRQAIIDSKKKRQLPTV